MSRVPYTKGNLHDVLLDCPSYQMSRREYWPEDTTCSLKEIFTDAQKTATATRLILALSC